MNILEKDATGTANREILLKRVLDAPRELVWKVWTDPAHIAQWWGPNGFTNTIHEMSVIRGGSWRFIMHGPDGVDYPNRIVFTEVVRPERLVYFHDSDIEDDPAGFEVTVSFADLGGKTELSMRLVLASAEERERLAQFGAIEGGNQTLNKLQDYLASTELDKDARETVIMRLFDAPRELVWRAWTEPEQVAQWWWPDGFSTTVSGLDLRPGGSLRLEMHAPDGTVFPMNAVFEEVLAPERLVFTSSILEDAAGIPALEVRQSVSFAEYQGKTQLTLRLLVLKAAPEAAGALAGMEMGWSQSLNHLEQLTVNR